MPIIGNPWVREAGAAGEGIGSTLAQAMIQMPQQRAQLAMQLAAQRQAQQQAMMHYALQQKAQAQESLIGNSEIALKQQELKQNEEQHKLSLAVEMLKAKNAAKGEYKFGETKEGRPYLLNTITGEHKWIDQPSDNGGMPFPGAPATQNQQNENINKGMSTLGNLAASGWNTNSFAPLFNAYSNRVAQALAPRPQGMGNVMTNAPAPVAPPAVPPQVQGAATGITNRLRWTPQGLVPVQ